VVNQYYKDTLCEDNFSIPKVRMRYHGPPITKSIAFQRSKFSVRYVHSSLLNCNTHKVGDDDASQSSRGIITSQKLQIQAAALHANAAEKMRRISSGQNIDFGENQSIISDVTLASNLSASELGFVRERRRFAFSKSRGLSGALVISDEMLRLNARLTMSLERSNGIKEQSILDPSVLVGHQIVMPYNKEMEAAFEQAHQRMPLIDASFIYIIIDTAKNNLRKTEYNVTNNIVGDSWVRLKRGKSKQGIEFRILRKVALDVDTTSVDDRSIN